jgi:hypothetical protein
LFERVIQSQSSRSTEIANFQNTLRYARSKVDFAVGEGIYMLPSDMNLRIGNVAGFNNKILVSKQGFRLGKNDEVNVEHQAFKGHVEKKTPSSSAVPEVKKSSNDDHEEEKLALVIFGTAGILGAYYFWGK